MADKAGIILPKPKARPIDYPCHYSLPETNAPASDSGGYITTNDPFKIWQTVERKECWNSEEYKRQWMINQEWRLVMTRSNLQATYRPNPRHIREILISRLYVQINLSAIQRPTSWPYRGQTQGLFRHPGAGTLMPQIKRWHTCWHPFCWYIHRHPYSLAYSLASANQFNLSTQEVNLQSAISGR